MLARIIGCVPKAGRANSSPVCRPMSQAGSAYGCDAQPCLLPHSLRPTLQSALRRACGAVIASSTRPDRGVLSCSRQLRISGQ